MLLRVPCRHSLLIFFRGSLEVLLILCRAREVRKAILVFLFGAGTCASTYIIWSDALVIGLLHLLFEGLGHVQGHSLVKLLDLEPFEVIIA